MDKARAKRIVKYFISPKILSNIIYCRLKTNGLLKWISDERFIKIEYKHRLGKKVNLENPVTYNEKLQWLKLHDRRAIYNTMVDKYDVKKYVSDIIGEEYIIPTLGVWENFEDIDFDVLPQQFVLKCTHDSGGLAICRDKKTFDMETAKGKIRAAFKKNFYWNKREWAYKDVKPRIIAEKYMEDSETAELRDYKFFTFNGVVKAVMVASGRGAGEASYDYFDENFNHFDMRRGHKNADVMPHKPKNFELMKKLAEKLSNGFPHIRVDFYEVDGKVYFGELTLYPAGGTVAFQPEEWDEIWGNWITLPPKTDK